jgi:membrane protease YdiL (CAAX protease family)
VIYAFVGWNEELFSRGYQLQTIASGLNLFWAAFLSSAVFGIIHLRNPHATWVGATGIFFAGLFFVYAYSCTRQLWLSIGLHIGWNFCEGVVFGFPVSGLEIYRLRVFRLPTGVDRRSVWSEAGLIILPAILLNRADLLVLRNRIVE